MASLTEQTLAGPYYRFRTFQDLYEAKWGNDAARNRAAVVKRLSTVPVYVLFFLLSGHFFPLDVVKTQARTRKRTAILEKY